MRADHTPDEAEAHRVRFGRSSRVLERLLDDELVLFDPRQQRVHILNATAAFIWRQCDGARELTEIAAALAAIYPGSRAAIAADVAATVQQLANEGLLAQSSVTLAEE